VRTDLASLDPDLIELVTRARLRDAAAFERLYLRYRGLIKGVLALEGCDRNLIDDVMQEVFTRVWRQLPALREVERFRPWLLQICRRTLIDQHRRAARSPRLLPYGDTVESLASGVPSPEEFAEATDLAARISVFVATMSNKDAVLLQRAAERQSGRPIRTSEAPEKSVSKVALHRARRRLADHLAASA
jgi:RNA polymerase sigma factor (sigma-70 family)